MRILVIAAHPDDEVLGCGGTIARLVREGHEVFITIMGEGITSRYNRREEADPELTKALHDRSRQVAGILGVKDILFFNLPDNRSDTLPVLEIVKIIEGLLASLIPDIVYTHHNGDLNIDHRLVHQTVLTATRPTKHQVVREVYAFEVPSSTEWSFQRFEPPFRPNIFWDISETFDVKLQAVECYDTEARPFPHPRSAEGLRAIAHRWGSVVGCQAAEAFELIRAIR